MKVQHFIPIVCSMLIACHTDSGVNPSEKYSKDAPVSYKVQDPKDLPACDDGREGAVFCVDSYGTDYVVVCAEKVWISLREATSIDLTAPVYSPAYDKTVMPEVQMGTVKDSRDSQTYNTVKIKNQVWFAENLRYGYFDMEDFCYENERTRGCLYTWDDVYALSRSQKGLCPSGYHVPSKDEWNTLIMNVGGYDVAGIALQVNDGISNDAVSFSVYPTGYYDSDATYYNNRYALADDFAPFWTSTAGGSSSAYAVIFYSGNPQVRISSEHHLDGYAVRCLKD